MPSMGVRIRAARKEMGLSQERFAQAVGVTRQTPLRWEKGEVQPQARHLAAIVRVTGKDVDYFFSEDEEESELSALRYELEALQAIREHEGNVVAELLRKVEHLTKIEKGALT